MGLSDFTAMGFSAFILTPHIRGNDSASTCLFMAKKNKPSMAERRQRRQGKMKGSNRSNPAINLPPCKLDFTTTSTATQINPEEGPIRVPNPTAAAEKAKELLKAQRASVNMLTLVKERIQKLLSSPESGVTSDTITTLQRQGYAVVDGFLDDEAIISELMSEAQQMLHGGDMEVDTSNLGTGEYITPLQGGNKQYSICPRMVEFVVSSTKNMPKIFQDDESSNLCITLNDSASMATFRAFDRKALKASLTLLMGNPDDQVLDSAGDLSDLAVIADKEDDQRRLAMYYYILPEDWDEECGGGLVFGSGSAPAKRDRLVIFYSDTTKCRAIPWKGKDDDSHSKIQGSTIELHLVNKR
jgi:hypothetical protein